MKKFILYSFIILIFSVTMYCSKFINPRKITLDTYENAIYSLSFSYDGKFLVSGSEGQHAVPPKGGSYIDNGEEKYINIDNIHIWSIPDGIRKKTYALHFGEHVICALLTHDNKLLIANSDTDINMWAIEKDAPKILKLPKVGERIDRISLSPDERLIAVAGTSNSVGYSIIYSMTTGEYIKELHITVPHFICDGKIIAGCVLGTRERVLRFEIDGWKRLPWLSCECGHKDYRTLTFTSDGKFLAIRGLLWSVEQDKKVRKFPGYLSVFSFDNKFIAVVHNDHSIKIYSIKSGKILKIFPKNNSKINAICLSPNNKYLAIGDRNGIKLYNLSKLSDD